MKPATLIILLSFFSFHSYSQNNVGLEAGLGQATFSPLNFSGNGDLDMEHTTRPDFTMSLYYLRKVGKHGYLGAKLSFQKYSFNYDVENYEDYNNYEGNIIHRSSFLFFTPTADIGLGRRQWLHVYFLAGPGVRIYGYQKTRETFDPNSGHADTTFVSAKDIYQIISRFGFGWAEHINVNKSWQITINEGFSFMLSHLAVIENIGNVHPGYFTFQVGVMHKLHKRAPKITEDETPTDENAPVEKEKPVEKEQ